MTHAGARANADPGRAGAIARLYAGLSIALIVLAGLQATHEPWSGDFWEHAAVVRELAAHPVAPGHPLLDLPTPHPLFTPYHLALGVVARATGVEPASVLSSAGLVNLAVLCLGLWRLATAWTGDRRVAPWLLLLTLFFWGHEPWRWSGMLHFDVLGRIAAYPSVLGLSLAMFAVAAASRYLAAGGGRRLVALALLTAAVLLIHPLSLPTLVFGTGAVCWQGVRDAGARRWLPPVIAVALGGLAAFAWPYYPLLRLLLGSGEAYDLQQYPIYEHLVERTFPILIAVPLLVGRIKKDARDPIAVTFCALAGVIALGYAFGRFSLGRILPGAILMVHLALADWIVSKAAPWVAARWRRSKAHAGAVAAALVFGVVAIGFNFENGWALCVPAHVHALAPYAFLRGTVQPNDVVLADPKTSAIVPVIAGRVVAVNNALPFVPDAGARRQAVASFFAASAGDAERERILSAFAVRWVLVDRRGTARDSGLESWLRRRGTPAHEDSRFLLVRIASLAP